MKRALAPRHCARPARRARNAKRSASSASGGALGILQQRDREGGALEPVVSSSAPRNDSRDDYPSSCSPLSSSSNEIQVPMRPCCSTPGFVQSQTPVENVDCSCDHCAGVNGTL
jgi:hypothetical protein